MSAIGGILLVVIAGLGAGSSGWPMRVIRKLRFEHFWFIGMLPLIIVPWIIVLTTINNPWSIYAEVGWGSLIISNLFAFGWGIANVLSGLCTLRIGFNLTGAILTSVGVMVAVTIPMIFKGAGPFRDSPDIFSTGGLTVLIGVAVILVGVIFTVKAGFGRERAIKQSGDTNRFASGGFFGGLIMAIIAGILSAGPSLAFVYGGGPIIQAMKVHGVGEISANFSVWAVGLLGGVLVNLAYPAWLMTKNHSWGVLAQHSRELFLAAIIGTQLIIAFVLQGMGMILLGALGASVGVGIQQIMQIAGGQGVGLISGEWRGIKGKPRLQMITAVAILFVAIIILIRAQ